MSDEGRLARERAFTLLELGRWDEAAEAARRALAADPEDVAMLDVLACSTMEAGRTDEGVDLARRLVAQDPMSPRAHLVLGRGHHLAGDAHAAVESYDEAIRLAPDHADAHSAIVEALLRQAAGQRRHRRERIARARHHAEESLRLAPDDAACHLVLAKVHLAEEDPAGARTHATHALSLQPDHPVGHQVLGIAAELEGDIGSAGDHYVDAARLDPTSSTSLDNLRGLRKVAPIGGLALYLLVRTTLQGGRVVGGVAIAVAVVVAIGIFVAVRYVIPRRRAERLLSERAKRALEIDDSLG